MKSNLLFYLVPAALLLMFLGLSIWQSTTIRSARKQLVENGFSIGFKAGVNTAHENRGGFAGTRTINKPVGKMVDGPSNDSWVSRLFVGSSGNQIKVVEGSRIFGDKRDYRGFEDRDLEPLTRLAYVEELFLGWNSISDQGLCNIAHFRDLTSLELVGCDITDKGIVNLSKFQKLRHLDLGHTAITDAAIKLLPEMQELQLLSLENTAITDASIDWIVSHEYLKELRLSHTKISQVSIEQLAGLSKLEQLYLDSTNVKDLSNVVKHMPKLNWLSADNTQIGDDTLYALRGPMDFLSIANTNVSSKAFARILDIKVTGYFYGEGTGLSEEQIEEIENRIE